MPTFSDIREAIDHMASHNIPEFTMRPDCAIFAKAVLDEVEHKRGACPKLIPEGDGGITFVFGENPRKIYWCILPDGIWEHVLGPSPAVL